MHVGGSALEGEAQCRVASTVAGAQSKTNVLQHVASDRSVSGPEIGLPGQISVGL